MVVPESLPANCEASHSSDLFFADVPGVDKLLAAFIARTIQDECLAPSFLDNTPFLEGDVAFPVRDAAAVSSTALRRPQGPLAMVISFQGVFSF